MNTSFSKIPILLFLFLLSGCHRESSDKQDSIAVIDIINNLGNYQVFPISELISELEYIPLETNDNCLIGAVYSMVVTPLHFFLQSYVGGGSGIILPGATRCYAFGRDGRFICEIGGVGQGPGEYPNISGLSIDENNQLIYIETYRNLLEYSCDGIFRRSVNKPQNTIEQPVAEVVFLNDNLFIGHYPNRGNEPYNFLLFNDSGQVIKTFENHIKFERIGNWVTIHDRSIRPFRVSERIYVKEYPNDTLFYLNKQNELIPQFVFDLGKYAFNQERRGGMYNEMRSNSSSELVIPFELNPIVGTPNYIFFSIMPSVAVNIPYPKGKKEGERMTPLGIYDIANKKTKLLETDPFSRKVGLINDIDGGLSFWPKYYTSSNEVVDVYQAYEMKEMLSEQYFASHEIKNSQAHHKLKELLKNLDYEDNPVIVIAKLKK